MADFNDVKICVRSLLTSSQEPLSILNIQKDYYQQEGKRIPYKSLGFNSTIELLQNMNDVVIVPPNPNPNSLLHLVEDEKTHHLRLLVKNQKSNTKKKKVKSNLSKSYRNSNGNIYFGEIVTNNSMSNSCSNFGNNENYNNKNSQFQRTGSNYHRSSQPTSTNRGRRSYAHSSNSSTSSDLYSNHSNQNGNCSPGYVTHKLQVDLERYISENKMIIPLNKFKELVKNHPHFCFLKASCMQDVIDLVQDFLTINENQVSLKHTSISNIDPKNNIPLIYQRTDTTQNSPNSFNTDQKNNLLPSSSIVNNNNKSVNNSTPYECDDKVVLSNLLQNLKISEYKVQDSFKNKWKNVTPINEVANKMNGHDKYIEECVKPKMVVKQDVNIYNNKKNSDYAKENFKKNIELVKKQTEILQNKKTERRSLNVSDSADYQNNKNSSENSETLFSHSTPNKNENNDVENAKISLNKNQSIPIEVLFNVARIFKKYDKGVNIENFKFIYSKMYHTIFDPTSYGFTSTLQMFMVLNQLIEIRNNVFYTKNKLAYSTMYKSINNNNKSTQNKIIPSILSNNDQKIVLHVDQQLFKSEDITPMVLVEVYSPSLFFLQLAYKSVEVERLSKQMQYFYSEKRENTKYIVQPEHIVPGLIYASSYSSFERSNQWHRVRVLREIDSETVHVIHVDFGTVDDIPKTELRFLKDVFGNLKCQAIHCCLTGYNELDTIAPKVTAAFLNCIGSGEVAVQVDNNFLLNEQYQILHVTLTMKKPKYPKIFININDEIHKSISMMDEEDSVNYSSG